MLALTGCGSSGYEFAARACDDYSKFTSLELTSLQPDYAIWPDPRYDQLDSDDRLIETNCINGGCEVAHAKKDVEATIARMKKYQRQVEPILASAAQYSKKASNADASYSSLFSSMYDLREAVNQHIELGVDAAVSGKYDYDGVQQTTVFNSIFTQIDDLKKSVSKQCFSVD